MILSWKERADVYCNYGSDVVLTNEVNKLNTNNSSALTDPLRNTSAPSGQPGGSTSRSSGPGNVVWWVGLIAVVCPRMCALCILVC